MTLDATGTYPRVSFSAPTNVNQSAGGLANPNNWYLRSVMDHLEESEGTQWSFRADGEYDLNTNWLDSLKFGARYAERQRWSVEILSASDGEHGGYKEIIARIEGAGAYSRLKFESGTHRVQRVPDTESQGRIHTSAATVAILPEMDEIDDIEINPADLKVDTFRASGAGGQHVNKTDSAIRMTHLPSGIVVECQDERSQHKNRARALSLLKAKLLDQQRSKAEAAQAETRRLQVGSGDRSDRIRTYNFPQGRLTDHRINLTLYKLQSIMEGDLGDVLAALVAAHEAEQLAELESSLPA